jgi:hypothetical protein
MIIVAIYIKVPITEEVAFTADTTLKTADTTLKTADATNLVTSTIDYQRLDLFDDEKISVTSAVADISDISKTLTDFSQSFTVPASDNNNKIFSHWYENKIDNGFDSRIRYSAYITLDGQVYRNGLIQLESSAIKERKPQSYTLTFFGQLVSLKDLFNGLLLKDLNVNKDYNFGYTGTVVKNKVFVGNNDDIKFPLISSLRKWSKTGGVDDIVNSSSTPMIWTELFPAIRLVALFKMMETQFGIKFKGSFMNNPRFVNAFLWLKNSDVFAPLYIGSTFISTAVTYYLGRAISTWDVATNTFFYVNPTPYVGLGPMLCNATFSARTPLSAVGKKFWFEIFYNGKSVSLVQSTVISNPTYGYIYAVALPNFSVFTENASVIPEGAYTYKFSCEIDVALTNVQFRYQSTYSSFPTQVWEDTIVSISNYTFISKVDITSIMPEIKLEDFFSGLLKQFNLTLYVETAGTYLIEPLDTYYSLGEVIDIGDYIVDDSITVDRVKWYKKVAYKYTKSETYFSQLYLGRNGISYGDLVQAYDNDEAEYTVQLPFENPLWTKLKASLVIGYCLNNNLQPVKPKPVILYDYNTNNLLASNVTDTNNFWFNDGTSTVNYDRYNAMGSEYVFGNEPFSLNFGAETSLFTDGLSANSLYQNFYLNYLSNIYNKKARIVKLKARLPLKILSKLKLYNRVRIKDKKYIINNFTADLTTLDVSMDLITDLRTASYFVNTIFVEDFDYVSGTQLVGQGGWIGSNTNVPVLVGTSPLYFRDYKSTGVGKSMTIQYGTNPMDVDHLFTPIASNQTFIAFMFRPSFDNSFVSTASHFFDISENSGGGKGKIFATSTIPGLFTLGLSEQSNNAPDVSMPYPLNTNKTYLIIVRHDRTTNKVGVFIRREDQTIPPNNPFSDFFTPELEVTLGSIIVPNRISFKQKTALVPQRHIIDGIRITDGWDFKL